MSVSSHFKQVLGAPLRNIMWSWGAIDSHNRLFLRVWEDEIKKGRVLVLRAEPSTTSNGYKERYHHLQAMREGAKGYGVVCKGPPRESGKKRSISGFDETSLLRFGKLSERKGDIYASIEEELSVFRVVAPRNSIESLTEDLANIESLDEEPTTKQTLTSARLGQGKFRTRVLKAWGGRCAVTGTSLERVIRASHIQPWCVSTNKERLDPNNGLPLVATVDALFDSGLISFDASGGIIISQEVPSAEQKRFGLNRMSLTRKPTPRMAKYLTYHREHRLRK